MILARANNRLTSQLDKLRAEHEKLQHLAAGQQAVARAKEAELAAEINGLKRLLKESLAERTTLHAQLLAKQVRAQPFENMGAADSQKAKVYFFQPITKYSILRSSFFAGNISLLRMAPGADGASRQGPGFHSLFSYF